MQELLAEYRSVIDEYHPELSATLRPGLPREIVMEQLSSLPFEISNDAVELYCWADGVNLDDDEAHLIPISFFWPFESAINSFDNLLPIADELERIFPQKYRQSFPFLSDGSDGGYGFGAIDEPCSGRIISYDIHADWTIAFNSLSDLIETAIEGYKIGLNLEYGEWDISGFHELVQKRYPDLNAG